MRDVFKQILIRGLRERQIPNRTQSARDWFRKQATFVNTTPNRLMLESPLQNLKRAPTMGKMYMYWYDPKHKDTLPLYDMFPCIIMIKQLDDGFHGLNLHYLGLRQRAAFFDLLYNYTNDRSNYDDKTKFMLTYRLLKRVSTLQAFRPCFKRYLTGHVRSRFLYIPPTDWDTAMFLPVAKWNDVNESRKQMLRPYKAK